MVLVALGDVDGMPSPFGTGAGAESGVDGLANAAHTSTAPIMPSPIAIKARTRRLECQLDELKISFHPLVDSGHSRPSAQHAGAPLNLSSTQAASVGACGWATSISDGGNDDWQCAIEGLLDGYDRSSSATRCRCGSTVLSHFPQLQLSVFAGNCFAPTAIG